MFSKSIRFCSRCVCAAALSLLAALLALSDGHAVVRFDSPQVDGEPMDRCLGFATDCGDPAAAYFCQLRGYTGKYNYNTIVSSQTKTLKTKEPCTSPPDQCNSFSFIECQSDSTSFLSPDAALAHRYAPVLRLSGREGPGVDLRTPDYPYTDYIPIDIHDITSTKHAMFVRKKDRIVYEDPLDNTRLDEIGGSPYNDSANNYVSLANVVQEYRQLRYNPSVYYRVLRTDPAINRLPIAIQYWFFYLYNNWVDNHPGDWETITVFLDANEQPAEAAYSTHFEANRHSWKDNIPTIDTTHPVVYVSNGGHGSYNHSGDTPYSVIGFTDNHKGDKEVLFPSGILAPLTGTPYSLINLEPLEKWESWLRF